MTKDTEFPPGSGKIVRGINLSEIAQKVGASRRTTCGTCHFNGGGGDGVKHGDLDTSLESPAHELDVHMDAKGLDFTCATCHTTDGHQVPGSRYAPTARDREPARMRGKHDSGNPATCQACHGQTPHQSAQINSHTGKLACQTCHIPAFARGGQPTKTWWDWSTAGKRSPDGKFLVTKDDNGYDTYTSIKGDFKWEENVKPEYLWFNGTVKYTMVGDKVEKGATPTAINRFEGSATDGKSMIWPVKVFRGKQAYDPVNQSLVVTHLAGNDDTAYWKNLDWEKAIAKGMDIAHLNYSGKVDFIETVSYWPITHMVAPKEKAVGCAECHTRNGRLEAVDGVYMPGRARDHARAIEAAGWALVGLVLLGVMAHGTVRVSTRARRSNRND